MHFGFKCSSMGGLERKFDFGPISDPFTGIEEWDHLSRDGDERSTFVKTAKESPGSSITLTNRPESSATRNEDSSELGSSESP